MIPIRSKNAAKLQKNFDICKKNRNFAAFFIIIA